MPVQEIKSAVEWNKTHDSNKNKLIVCDFSAAWCGPCEAIAPVYHQLSEKYAKDALFLKLDVDEVREIAQQERIQAMPSFGFYVNRTRHELVQGGDARKIESLIKELSAKYNKSPFSSQGHVLGSSNSSSTGGGLMSFFSSKPNQTTQNSTTTQRKPNPWADPNFSLVQKAKSKESNNSHAKNLVDPPKPERKSNNTPWNDPNFKPSVSKLAAAATETSTETPEATSNTPVAAAPRMSTTPPPQANPDLLTQLTDMGFPEIRAQKALLLTKSQSLEAALDWIAVHQDDKDVDEPLNPESSVVSITDESPPGLSEEEQVLWYEMQEKKQKNIQKPVVVTSSNAETAKKSIAEMTSAEKQEWLEKKRQEAKARRAQQELERMKMSEKNRQNLTKAVGEMRERIEEEQNKKALEKKRREEMEARKAKASILAKIQADKERRKIEQQKAIEEARKLKEMQAQASKK